MKNTILKLSLITICSTLLGCSIAKKDSSLKFIEISHGTIKSSGSEVSKDKSGKSPSGNYVSQFDCEIDVVTDTIKGEIGQVFGVNFKIVSPKSKFIKVKRSWIFPEEITMPNGKKTQSLVRKDFVYTNDSDWMYYTIEKESEIIKGTWTVQYYFKGEEIYRKNFIMI